MNALAILRELVDAIDARTKGCTDRQRANIVSPRVEDAINAARAVIDERGGSPPESSGPRNG
jgi:hypothetical protein